MAGNDVRIRAWVKDEVSGALTKIKDKFDHVGKSKGFQSIVSGIGMGAGIAAFNAITNSVGRVVDVMGDAVTAAIEEEQSVKKLGAALQANVAGYDGTTEAIEKTLAARMRLGFSDDEQRDSLARLVSTTKDSTDALRLQRQAMDLARLRNIDLAAASDIVGKVYGGNIGILARYGIQLKKGISPTEALAEVQRRAAGQAEAYANTLGGQLEANQINMNERLEQLGIRILPAVVGGFDALIGVLDTVAGSTESSLRALDSETDRLIANNLGWEKQQELLELVRAKKQDLLNNPFALQSEMDEVNAMIESLGDYGDSLKTTSDHTADMAAHSRSSWGIASNAADGAAGDIDGSTEDIIQSYDEMVDALTDDTSRLIDDVYDPAILHAELAATKEEYAEQKRIATSKNSTDEQIRDAKRRMLTLTKNADETRLQLLEAGELTAEETKEWLTKLERRYNKSTGRAKADVGALIAKIKELSAVTAPGIDIVIRGLRTAVGKGQLRAAGGPIDPGKVYMVGENGPEMFVSKDAGTIVPNHKLGGGKKGSVGPLGLDSTTITVNVVSPGVLSPAHGQAIAREIGPHLRDYLNRRG